MATVLLLAVAGCGGDGDQSDAGTTEPTETTEPTPSLSTAELAAIESTCQGYEEAAQGVRNLIPDLDDPKQAPFILGVMFRDS